MAFLNGIMAEFTREKPGSEKPSITARRDEFNELAEAVGFEGRIKEGMSVGDFCRMLIDISIFMLEREEARQNRLRKM